MGESAEALHLLVSGRVQGVGFRYLSREAALDAGLSGWVRNLYDGRVEILAEGEPAQLERLESWLRGPSAPGRVDHVVRRVEPVQGLEGFGIRPTASA